MQNYERNEEAHGFSVLERLEHKAKLQSNEGTCWLSVMSLLLINGKDELKLN